MKCWLPLLCALVSLVAAGCGGGSSSPAAPSRPSPASSSGTGAVAIGQPATSSLFGNSAVDLASCLNASADAACFSGARMSARAVGAAVTAPGAPVGFSTSASGSTVTLTWTAPNSGDPVTTYVIEAGSSAGLANLYNSPTNSTATTFSASGVGAGTYYVRVRAQNAGGLSGPSNESVLTVGPTACTSAPNAPGGLVTVAAGSTVTLTWTAPTGGCAPTSYILQAGSAAGLSNLANSNTGNTSTSYVAQGVGVGTYFVRILAANAYGQSAASNEVTVIVGTPSTGVSGTWIGLVADGDGTSLNSGDCGLEKSDWRLDLTQSGSTVTGTLTQTTRVSGCDPAGLVKSIGVVGSVSGTTFSFNLVNQPSRNATATFTATRMTGTTDFAGTFALNRR